MQTNTTTVSYNIQELIPYINWIYFFHAWGFQAKFASIAEYQCTDYTNWLDCFPEEDQWKASETISLYNEALCLLNEMSGENKIYALYRLMDANSDGDNLLLNGKNIPLLRQQTHKQKGDPFLCLSDFVYPLSSNKTDTIGVFATTIDLSAKIMSETDLYKQLLLQVLGERLAEAAAEKLHETIRKEIWGYAKDEHLTMKQLLNEEYQGIRPAVGYPSLPDISIIFLLNDLIDMKQIGIQLTENGMMIPHASICGLMFAHPASRYFSVGKIDEEQLKDYAKRRGLGINVIKKFLTNNL